MTLNEVKTLLVDNNVDFDMREYENEAAYWHHRMLFPHTKNADNCKVIALIIASNNKKKDIELQFNDAGSEFYFEELSFGEYCFEMSDFNEEMLAEVLLNRIKVIQSGNFVVVIANDLTNRRWLGDSCFDLNDDNDMFGRPGFEKAMEQIKKPKGLISRFSKSQRQFEIYDWNSYQRLVK